MTGSGRTIRELVEADFLCQMAQNLLDSSLMTKQKGKLSSKIKVGIFSKQKMKMPRVVK